MIRLNRCPALPAPKLLQRLVQPIRRIQVVLKEELHRPLACFTSVAHTMVVQHARERTRDK
jgi:hypothetical protein